MDGGRAAHAALPLVAKSSRPSRDSAARSNSTLYGSAATRPPATRFLSSSEIPIVPQTVGGRKDFSQIFAEPALTNLPSQLAVRCEQSVTRKVSS